MSARPSLAEQALKAISEHLAQGDWGNAELVLNSYAADPRTRRRDGAGIIPLRGFEAAAQAGIDAYGTRVLPVGGGR